MTPAALLLAASFLSAAPPLTQAPARPTGGLVLPAGATLGPAVPGLRQDAVPQGLAWVPADGPRPACFLVSHDRPGEAASCVSVLDAAAGTLRAVVDLAEPDGAPHRGHVGGVAVSGGRLFVASDDRVLRFPLSPFLAAAGTGAVAAESARADETRASFCTARRTPGGDELWVGEFARLPVAGKAFRTDPAHHLRDRAGVRKYAWAVRSDPADPAGRVTGVLSVRQRVQGMAFLPPAAGEQASRVVLSVSYGRRADSLLAVYDNPTGGPPHRRVRVGGRSVPLWLLDGRNHRGALPLPPMSEGVAVVPGVPPRPAVLFESGAAKYLPGGRGPLDSILLLPAE